MIGRGGTIGIIGAGQLGRMLALAAAPLGYKVHIYAPDEGCAAAVAAGFVKGAFDDEAALTRFAAGVEVVTYEFENLPVAPLAALGDKLHPGVRSLAIAQDRAAEKGFIERTGARVAPWRQIDRAEDLAAAIADLGLPLLLKSRRLGYDGKGQAWVNDPADGLSAWQRIGNQPAIAEARVDYLAEFSVLLARTASGEIAHWEVPRNHHQDGVLRRSEVPAGLPAAARVTQAIGQAHALAQALDHIGVMTVEFFATAAGPLVNEIAPRVHNSGHWTIEGAVTSQFEQHVRAVCGLPLGSTALSASGATMDNLLGDEIDQWQELVRQAGAHVHDYDKGAARPGRKMGHVTRITP